MDRAFPRNIASLEAIFAFAEEFFAREAIGPEPRFAVQFALEEMFTNMVKYQAHSPHEILIRLECADDRIELRLTDYDVEPFDPTRVEPPAIDVPLEKRRVGGLGVHLTRMVMDSVEYEYVDRQSTITLTKKLG